MLTIDGAMGEGGGQILRSALALSLCLGRAFRIVNIRAARKSPGLRPQHLAAVRAAAELGQARVEGAAIGARELGFTPRAVRPGRYRFDIGTAGSTVLVLQTLLPALLTASGPSDLVLEGGTHNPLAPPFEFLERVFLPLIARMGPRVGAVLERPGFYPAGGGVIRVEVRPVARLAPLHLEDRGEILDIRACAVVAHLDDHIAHRELKVIGEALGLAPGHLVRERWDQAKGPGNVVTVTLRARHITELCAGVGKRGVRAEAVAGGVVRAVRRYLRSGVAVGEHLADQLVLPLALAGGSTYVTLPPSRHTTTNIAVLGRFLDIPVCTERLGAERYRITLG
jgi:RNA 3'-terminal phosphate cyclase (ATP)